MRVSFTMRRENKQWGGNAYAAGPTTSKSRPEWIAIAISSYLEHDSFASHPFLPIPSTLSLSLPVSSRRDDLYILN